MSASLPRTLDNMLRNGFTARAYCPKCKVSRMIDLEALAAKVGRDYSLWNRRCRCKLTDGCSGWVRFHCGPGWGHFMVDTQTQLRWMREG